jgi:hypothetical protein
MDKKLSKPAKCPKCGAPDGKTLRLCPACGEDLGFPNVRAALEPIEVEALSDRFEAARDSAEDRGLRDEFSGLIKEVRTSSRVVVAMPLLYARNFLTDRRQLYRNYEELVGTGHRVPSPAVNDVERHAASGKLFGAYASEIRYGVLSLDGTSLPNYGHVFVKLRDIAIKERVSFLHENSYLFLDQMGVTVRGEIPVGFRCGWDNRTHLVAAKMEPILQAGSGSKDWARQLVQAGTKRSEDKCVEAHIYGSFNRDSVESVAFAGPGENRRDKADMGFITELMVGPKAKGVKP